MMPYNAILIGYRCCGKTSVGKCLAKLLSCEFVDTDKLIELQCCAHIEKLVADRGWTYFRQAETQVLEQISHKKQQVISTGGGMVLAAENRALMRSNEFVIWLTADVDTIVQRLTSDDQNRSLRPRFTDRDLFVETREILARRTPIYEKMAHMTVDTTRHKVQDIAWMIKRRLDHVWIQFRQGI